MVISKYTSSPVNLVPFEIESEKIARRGTMLQYFRAINLLTIEIPFHTIYGQENRSSCYCPMVQEHCNHLI